MRFFWLFLVLFFVFFGSSAKAEYDVYVDAGNDTGIEDGTEASPFNTINEGVALAAQNSSESRKIWVATGEYREQVELSASVELYGAGDDKTIILGKDSEDKHVAWAVKMRDETKLKDLGVKYGKQGVLVASGADVEIDDCRIYKSKENGIFVEKARGGGEDFVLKNSKIYDSEKRGMYIKKKKVEIEDNEIYENEEEGIDLRSSVQGTIADNEIYKNGESGLEMELRRADLKVRSNKIYSNKTNGINFQYRGVSKAGKVKMSSNKIYKNKSFGLRCSAPSGGRPMGNYFSAAITLSKDKVINNVGGFSSAYCKF